MTREAILKNKEIFDAWLDGKQIQILDTNGNWVDVRTDVKWKEHREYRIKPTGIKFEDCSFNEIEYCVNIHNEVLEYSIDYFRMSNRKGLIKDKEIAEAYSVLPQLIRLMDEYNEGWKPDWKSFENKHAIGCYEDTLESISYQHRQKILAFKTPEIRDEFLEDHRDLIEKAKPLL